MIPCCFVLFCLVLVHVLRVVLCFLRVTHGFLSLFLLLSCLLVYFHSFCVSSFFVCVRFGVVHHFRVVVTVVCVKVLAFFFRLFFCLWLVGRFANYLRSGLLRILWGFFSPEWRTTGFGSSFVHFFRSFRSFLFLFFV